ncbi:MAG: DNA-protecting protein DprA [Thermoleophilia bacterium]|nr:DNA-protecting protein DprA [Thermoleophilia bacterium]
MKACTECLLKSLLDNEAVGFAEKALLPAGQARQLMALPQVELVERLRGTISRIDERLSERVDALRNGDVVDGLWMTCVHDGDFPARLKDLQQQPAVIYGVGSTERLTSIEKHHGVAIVGARRASAYGRDVAYQLGRDLASAGMTVVSGMALGIDGTAHRGALQVGGRTIAVLAGGPERPYPSSHRRLYEQIVAEGAVISERPPGSRAQRWGFPARNRLIAALAVKTVFVEGTETSGAMHTVRFAEELGQSAAAVPGPVTSPLSAGTNNLLHDQVGGLVRDARDVLDQIFFSGEQLSLDGIEQPAPPPPVTASLPPSLRDVFERVRAGDGKPQAIAAGAQWLEPREIVVALGELELAGHVERDERGGYRSASTSPRGADSMTR